MGVPLQKVLGSNVCFKKNLDKLQYSVVIHYCSLSKLVINPRTDSPGIVYFKPSMKSLNNSIKLMKFPPYVQLVIQILKNPTSKRYSLNSWVDKNVFGQ